MSTKTSKQHSKKKKKQSRLRKKVVFDIEEELDVIVDGEDEEEIESPDKFVVKRRRRRGKDKLEESEDEDNGEKKRSQSAQFAQIVSSKKGRRAQDRDRSQHLQELVENFGVVGEENDEIGVGEVEGKVDDGDDEVFFFGSADDDAGVTPIPHKQGVPRKAKTFTRTEHVFEISTFPS